MKKTLLATAIAGAAFASGAQAATVYNEDGTNVDLYGRISVGINGGGQDYDLDNTGKTRKSTAPDFVDAYSRMGLRLSHDINSDLTAFGRLEWRFQGDEDQEFEAFSETRQSYLGLKSDSWGTIQGGNFDSFYNQAVSLPFDPYIDRGLEFAGHPIQSRGDSLGYITPDMAGFQVFLQGKHYSNQGDTDIPAGATDSNGDPLPVTGTTSDKKTKVAFQGALKYEQNGLRLALGAVDDVHYKNEGGNDEMLYGVTAAYEILPGLIPRIGYETQDDNDRYYGGHDTWGFGTEYAPTQDLTFQFDYYSIDEDESDSKRDAFAAGAYYDVASNFDIFLELNDAGNDKDRVRDTKIKDLGDDMYYITGARYFF